MTLLFTSFANLLEIYETMDFISDDIEEYKKRRILDDK